MEVLKIGGAVLKNRDGFFRMVDILQNYTAKPALLVISAFSNATRRLESAAQMAVAGKLEPAIVLLNEIIQDHTNYASEIFTNQGDLDKLILLLNMSREEIEGYLRGLSITRELTPRTHDLILSFGELVALQTVCTFLFEQGIAHACIDATKLIVSDSSYGSAKPDYELSKANVLKQLPPIFKKSDLVITQGFVARSPDGEITTMGMESSNLTAVVLASILDVDKVTFWTDVEGIRTADNKLCSSTQSIAHLDYQQAYKYSQLGLKLIHPEMIAPAEKKNIELIYKSAFNPEGDHTSVLSNKSLPEQSIILQRSGLYMAEYSGNISDFKALKSVFDPVYLYYCNQSLKSLHSAKPDNSKFKILYDNCSLISILNFDINSVYQALGNIIPNISIDIFIDAEKKTTYLIACDKDAPEIISQLHTLLF